MCPSAPRVCSEPGGQKQVLSLSLDRITSYVLCGQNLYLLILYEHAQYFPGWEAQPFHCHDDVIRWKHFPPYWPFVRGIHRSPVNFLHKGQRRETLIFSLIRTWINGWLNNCGAGGLRRHCAHYDVTVMVIIAFVEHSGDNDYLRTGDPTHSNAGMMTSSNGNIFRVTGPLCGKFTGLRWIPRTKAIDAELWCFVWSASE